MPKLITAFISSLSDNPIFTAGEAISALILLLTLAVLIVYTIATFGLWNQARQQTELQLSPFLNFDIDEKDQFFIKNFGNSPAFNVIFDRFTMVINDLPGKPVWAFQFETIPIIEKMEKKLLKVKNFVDGEEENFDWLSVHLNPKYQNEVNHRFSVWYKNSLGRSYITKLQTGRDGLQVLAIRRATILERTRNKVSNYIDPLHIWFLRWNLGNKKEDKQNRQLSK